ncbi:MAG: sugar ABC transporter ATP-binding protein [Chloroflexota bacterium]
MTAGAASTSPLLAMLGIRKSFAGGEVLHGVDLTLQRGEVRALVGQNGAGKSTLMKVLGGVYVDYEGDIEVDGRPLRLEAPHAAIANGIAVIYQEFALVPDLTVAENIALGREPAGAVRGTISHRAIRERSAEVASRYGIQLPLDTPVAQLPVAEQQLTEILKALSRDARILVMDEPTARLSARERDRLFEIIRSLSAEGVGIVYISHFLEEIFAVAHSVTVLRDGDVVASQPTESLDLATLTTLLVGAELRGFERQGHAPADAPVVLEVRDLVVGGRQPVSFEVRAGEVLGFAGLVGSGRSRLARALVGAQGTPASVTIAGRRIVVGSPRAAAAAGMLYLPEDRKHDGLVGTSSVRANLVLTALGRQLSSHGLVLAAACRRVARSLIDRLRIVPPDPEREVSTLSGGNQQKVLLGRALAAEARVLILDQPTAGVDVGAKAEIYAQVDQMAQTGLAVMVISDDLDELLSLADRIVVMHGGRVTQVADATTFTRPELLRAITTGGMARAA